MPNPIRLIVGLAGNNDGYLIERSLEENGRLEAMDGDTP